jgi:hypothetical protein
MNKKKPRFGSVVHIRPAARRVHQSAEKELPRKDDRWHVERPIAHGALVVLRNEATGHILSIRRANIKDYRPLTARRPGKSAGVTLRSDGFLNLNGQVILTERGVFLKPLPPGRSPGWH